MSKIQIAYLIDTIESDTTGTEKQLLEIIRRLDRGRFDPKLICLWESDWMRENELPCDVTVLGYRGFLKINLLQVIARLSRFIESNNIKILQTFFVESIFIAYFSVLWAKCRTVLLSSRRDIGLGTEPSYHKYFKLLLPYVDRRFDGIVANGENIKRYIMDMEHVPGNKILVIHNGVTIPNAPVIVPELFNDKHADTFRIGIAASLAPVKRIDVFLEALERLKRRNDSVKFSAVILGDGPEKERLQKQAVDAGLGSLIHFTGSVKNVSDYLMQLDIGVLCSDREGFSNSILEYMACRLPVVATAVGGNTELVDVNNGICVPPGNPEALSRALEILWGDRDLRERMGASSFEKVLTRYTWDCSMNQLETFYEGFKESRLRQICDQ